MLIAEPTVREDLKILRLYSKAIERNDFPGPYQNKVFRKERTDTHAKCKDSHHDYALHHLARRRNPRIAAIEAEFKKLQAKEVIPSLEQRELYRSMVRDTEGEIIRTGADIVLCTCNEASSLRVMESLEPVYCIIDECAMATEPECMVPIRRAEHVVLIGDHQQLQPVIQYREAAEMGLNTSLFERYVNMIGRDVHVLRKQYRMVR